MTALPPQSHTGFDRVPPLPTEASTPYRVALGRVETVRFYFRAESSTSALTFVAPEALATTGGTFLAFSAELNAPMSETSPHISLPLAMRAVEAHKRRVQRSRNAAAIALLRSWLNVNEQDQAEHRETLAYLREALDQDRPSNRKLFP